MNARKIFVFFVIVVLGYFLYTHGKSGFGSAVPMGAPQDVHGAPIDQTNSSLMGPASSASLLPKEVTASENYGGFSPSEILSNQNYLDPRAQIGFPETIGGSLRNANRQVRSEPMNPKQNVSIFLNSTIPADTMRPAFEIGSGMP